MPITEQLRQLLYLLPMPVALKVEAAKRIVRPPFGHRRALKLHARLHHETTILAGPFQGMRYLAQAHGSTLLPKIVGTYEIELHETLERLCRQPLDLAIDIGAAEGYYAVGLARRLPHARVIGFDINKRARYFLRQLAQLNGVADRLDIRELATPDSLESALAHSAHPLVLCDCEGAEIDILVPRQTPSLARAVLLIETHDGKRPGVTPGLTERFAPTHDIQTIPLRPRTSADLPAHLRDWSTEDQLALMDEGRMIPQTWLLLTPRR